MGDLLHLTPTTIAAKDATVWATITDVEAATTEDGATVWRVVAEPEDALTATARVIVEYGRWPGKPCPVTVGESIRVPRAPLV